MKRYAAKLLFQWRVVAKTRSGNRRLCEERIVLLRCRSARRALVAARRTGRSSECTYRNRDRNPVHFEFVGVLDLLQLGIEAEKNEVWYDLITRVRPMEHKRRILPRERDLSAIRCKRRAARGLPLFAPGSFRRRIRDIVP